MWMMVDTPAFLTCPHCSPAAHDSPCPECGGQISELEGLKKQLEVVKHRAMIVHFLEVKFKTDIENISFKIWSRDEVIDLFIDLVAGCSRKIDSVQNVPTKNA